LAITPVVQPNVNSGGRRVAVALVVPHVGDRDRGASHIGVDRTRRLPVAVAVDVLLQRVEKGRAGLRRIVDRVLRNDVGDLVLDDGALRRGDIRVLRVGEDMRVDQGGAVQRDLVLLGDQLAFLEVEVVQWSTALRGAGELKAL